VRRGLCLQILRGVAYLHNMLGVAHRDIKMGNLVVT
jgi:serine/threonine protein kinase